MISSCKFMRCVVWIMHLVIVTYALYKRKRKRNREREKEERKKKKGERKRERRKKERERRKERKREIWERSVEKRKRIIILFLERLCRSLNAKWKDFSILLDQVIIRLLKATAHCSISSHMYLIVPFIFILGNKKITSKFHKNPVKNIQFRLFFFIKNEICSKAHFSFQCIQHICC